MMNYILIPSKGVQVSICLDAIIYLESEGAYTHVVTDTGKFVSSKNLGYYERLLPPPAFIRSHHSFIVSLAKIKAIKKGRSGLLVMSDSTEVPIAQRRMNAFRNYFTE